MKEELAEQGDDWYYGHC